MALWFACGDERGPSLVLLSRFVTSTGGSSKVSRARGAVKVSKEVPVSD